MPDKKISFPARICNNCSFYSPLHTFPLFGTCGRGYSFDGRSTTSSHHSCKKFEYAKDPSLLGELKKYQELTGINLLEEKIGEKR